MLNVTLLSRVGMQADDGTALVWRVKTDVYISVLSETKLTSQLFVWVAHMIHKFQDGVSSLPLFLSLFFALSLYSDLQLPGLGDSGFGSGGGRDGSDSGEMRR